MLNPRSIVLLAVATLAATIATAQEPAAPAPVPAPPPSFRLTLDLGYVKATGNTNVTTLSLGDELSFKVGRWEFKEIGAVVYGRTGDSTTAEQIRVGGRADVQVVSLLHLFVGVTYERNRFAGISRRFEEVAGVGLRLINRPATVWSLEAGSSSNQQRSTAGLSTGFLAVRLATLFRHNFTNTAYFQESADWVPNLETKGDWRANSETAVVAAIAGRVALKVSYSVRVDNQPEPGFQKSDRILTTAVQIAF